MERATTREGIPFAEKTETAPLARFHYMDNLRALAMLAGILFHAALAYSPLMSQLWMSASPMSSPVFDAVAWFSHLFRMPLFFLIAGFFACYLVMKRGVGGFLKNRGLRIALPFVIFLPLIWISFAVIVGWAMENVENPSPMLGVFIYFSQMPDAPPPPVSTTHLWFLYVLAQFCLIYAALEKFNLIRDSLVSLVTRVPVVVFLLPLLMVPGLVSVASPTPAPEQFMPSLWYFSYFGVFFLLGALVFRHQQFLEQIRLWAPWLAISSIAMYVIVYRALPEAINLEEAMASMGGVAFSWSHLGIATLEAYISLHMTLVCLVVGQALLNRSNRALRLVADSSYWVYILHLPVLFLIQFVLLDTDLGLWTQFAISSIGTFLVGFVSYLILVRWTPIGWLLNGRRKRGEITRPGPLGDELTTTS